MRATVVVQSAILALCLASAGAAPEVIEHENGLIVKIVKKSKSCVKTAKNGDDLAVQYVGRLTNAKGKIFDQSKEGNDFKFKLGSGQVIQGYEQGVPGMCLGEIRTLTVPPELGYGARGVPGTIPADATLHFTVKLMNVQETPNSKAEL